MRISRRSMRKRLPSMRINDLEYKRICRDAASLTIESMSDEGEWITDDLVIDRI